MEVLKNIKTRVLLSVLSIALAAIAGWNIVENRNKVELSDLALANVEALAHCESEVKHGYGRTTNLECHNSRGEKYTLSACHFDMAYSTNCEGVPVD